MLFNTTTDIASLWKLALVGLVLFFLVAYRKQLVDLFEKGTVRFRHRDTKVEVSGSTRRLDPPSPPEGETDAPPDEGDEAGETIVVPTEPEVDGVGAPEDDGEPSFGRVLVSVRDGDSERADALFARLQESAETDDARLENQVLYASYRAAFSQGASAIAELSELTSEPRVASLAKRHLAFLYERKGFPDRALELYTEVSATTTTDRDISQVATGTARCLRRLERGDETYGILYAAISKVHDADDKRDLFVGLADQHEMDGDWLHRAIALDKATELAPNDATLRFRVGYAFAQANYDDLALMHYKATLDIDDLDSAARNNLGVAYEGLGMPIHAIESYRRASKDGNTLGAANLANRLINAGFIPDAREILSEAATADDAHPNVATNTARLKEASDAENEKEKVAVDRAQAQDIFFREYGSALTSVVEPPALGGDWVLENGVAATVEQDGTTIRINWTEAKKPHKLEGRIVGNGVRLARYAWEHPFLKREMAFVEKDEAYGYVVSQDELRVSVCAPSESRVVRTFRRA